MPINGWREGDVVGYALTEDGHGLVSHLSSNKAFSQHDMGLTSDWHHDSYQKHYPEGFALEWVDNPNTHEGLKNALELNKSLYQAKIKSECKIEVTIQEAVQ
jgi:hypothetical protein